MNGHVRVIKPLRPPPVLESESDESINENGIELEEYSDEISETESTENGQILETNVKSLSEESNVGVNINSNDVASCFNSVTNNNVNKNGIDNDSDTSHSEEEEIEDTNSTDYLNEQYNQIDESSNNSNKARKRKKSTETDSSENYSPRLSKGVGPSRRSMRARKPVKRPNYVTDSDSDNNIQTENHNRPTRSIIKRHYRESVESSSDSTQDRPKFSISSRGRIRKITARARAFLRD